MKQLILKKWVEFKGFLNGYSSRFFFNENAFSTCLQCTCLSVNYNFDTFKLPNDTTLTTVVGVAFCYTSMLQQSFCFPLVFNLLHVFCAEYTKPVFQG